MATLLPPPRMLTQSLRKTGGQKIIASYQPFTCLREELGGEPRGNFAYNKAQANRVSVMKTMYYLFFYFFHCLNSPVLFVVSFSSLDGLFQAQLIQIYFHIVICFVERSSRILKRELL